MESDPSVELLGKILKTLEKIQDGLEAQDEKIHVLEQRLDSASISERIAGTGKNRIPVHPKSRPEPSRKEYQFDGNDDLSIKIPIQTNCKRQGCRTSYTGWDRTTTGEICSYHPGVMV